VSRDSGKLEKRHRSVSGQYNRRQDIKYGGISVLFLKGSQRAKDKCKKTVAVRKALNVSDMRKIKKYAFYTELYKNKYIILMPACKLTFYRSCM
jgi:hypothetical protein